MARINNLKNTEATQFGNGLEAAENGRKGGKASGEARRRAKTYREIARIINEAPANDAMKAAMKQLNIDSDGATNSYAVPLGLYQGVVAGNVQSIEKWMELTEDKQDEAGKVYELPARVIGKAFVDINRNIHSNIRYVFKGGRGGLKSSFISLKIIELLKNNQECHAVIVRKVGATLKDSVYAQMQWAIRELNLESEFKITKSPLEITLTKTGQKIFFRGVDDPMKLKGIKVTFGYIGIVWKEELDQLAGPNEERMVNQSVLRGGLDFYDFCSYNPPRSRSAWVNEDEINPSVAETIFHNSTYLDAPPEWLGPRFIDDAEFLKEMNPAAYENEYLGVANGDGGSVFENLEIREITDDEISRFDNILMGIDWGFYPDPFQWGKCHYDAARLTLYIFDEYRAYKAANRDTWDALVSEKGVRPGIDLITADSAEPKSIGDYKDYGALIRGAVKGPDSVRYGMKWLQSLKAIVIDPIRCPDHAREFANYEYERTPDGEIISGFPDAENHCIDEIRYSTERIWRRKGQ